MLLPSVPGMGVPRLHPKPCWRWSSGALLGIINGRVRGSRGKGKDSNLEIKRRCSVTSPEPPNFAARCSWSPAGAPALGAVGGAGWGGCSRGGCPPRVSLCEGTRGGSGLSQGTVWCYPVPASPSACARGVPLVRGNWGVQPAGSWQCPAPPVPPSPIPAAAELRVYLVGGDETHTHARDNLTVAHVLPQILKPYVTLLFPTADFVRWLPLWKSACSGTGTVSPTPKGSPTPPRCPPGPAKSPSSLRRALPLVFTVVRNLLKRLFCL